MAIRAHQKAEPHCVVGGCRNSTPAQFGLPITGIGKGHVAAGRTGAGAEGAGAAGLAASFLAAGLAASFLAAGFLAATAFFTAGLDFFASAISISL